MFEDHALRAKCIVPFLLFPPPRPICSYGPFKWIQADIVDMAIGGHLRSTKEAHTFWPLNTASRSFAACK